MPPDPQRRSGLQPLPRPAENPTKWSERADGLPRDAGVALQRPEVTISHATLPTPPAALARIIGAAGDPEVSVNALGHLLEVDPAFSTSVLGLVNSAAYGMGRQVRSVQQAAVVLGLRAIRNMAVSQAVRAATEHADTGAFDATRFWEDSLRRATAAVAVARHAGYQDPSEAFTVGLIQDLGTLALAVEHPGSSAGLQAAATLPGPERIAEERRLTGVTHPEHFVEVGAEWGLPEDLVRVIAGHHGDEPLESRRDERLRKIAAVADAVADVVQCDGDRSAIDAARRVLSSLESREPLDLEQLLAEVAEGMSAAAADLRIQIGAQPSFEELMSRANEALISINASYEELTQQLQESNQRLEESNRQLEEALHEKQELEKQLRASNERLRRLAATDMLTGVANRRAFTAALEHALEAAQASREPLSLVMLDIDHFKAVNDTHGHAAGDDVLKEICRRLRATLREQDLVGRLGGEEFAVILGATSPARGHQVAERLRTAIAAAPVTSRDGITIAVTSSFGGVTACAPPLPDADTALNRADEALYRSKEGGRDRVTWCC